MTLREVATEEFMRTYDIPDISCGGCVKAVTRVLTSLDPEAKVEADLATKRVGVDTRASEAEVLAALSRAGYPATPRAAAPGA